jgi:hypothetical protein
MKTQLSTSQMHRVLLRPARGSPEAEQRERAAIVAGLGAKVQEFGGDAYEDWAAHARPGDILIVHRLEIIPPIRSRRCPSPANALAEIRGVIRGRGVTLIESKTGDEPTAKRWREAIDNVRRGARMIHKRAGLVAGGKATAERNKRESPVLYWRSSSRREAMRAIWMSRAYANSDEAANAVNVECERLGLPRIGSTSSCIRAFGDRGIKSKR